MSKQQQTTQQYPVIVVEVPRQSPPRAWAAYSDDDLISACVPYCDRSGESYPETAEEALAVLRHDLFALALVTREAWEAAQLGDARALGLPQHQQDEAYQALAQEARREGWWCAGQECIRHSPDGSPIVWGPDGETRCATQRDMDTLPVGPDLTDEEWDAIEE